MRQVLSSTFGGKEAEVRKSGDGYSNTASQRTGACVDVTEKLGYLPPFLISFQASLFQLC